MTARRYDLDWLRFGAFGLLILYHVGMVFVPWDYHIKTAHPARWVEAPMLLTNAWRMALLFVISGVAARHLLAKLERPGAFARARTARLAVPLLFVMVALAPPTLWVDVTVNHGYARGLLAFWAGDYWRFDKSLGVVVPTWDHLWFVVYLWLYCLILAAAAALVRDGTRLQARFDTLFGGARLVTLPIAWLVAVRLLLGNRFPETHALVDDWQMHLVYGGAFVFGIGLAGSRTLWAGIARVWRPMAVAALIGWAVVVWADLGLADDVTLGAVALVAVRTARAVQTWGAIVALLGLAAHFWNHDHRWRATLTEAVFPAYIVHQPLIVGLEFALRPFGLPGWGEAAILIPATAAGCAAFYLIGRRVGWLRPLIGLARQTSAAPSCLSNHSLRPIPPA